MFFVQPTITNDIPKPTVDIPPKIIRASTPPSVDINLPTNAEETKIDSTL